MRSALTVLTPPRRRSPASALPRVPGLRRAWPQEDGSITFEAVDGEGLLRAGRIGPAGRWSLAPYATDPALPALSPEADGDLVVHRLGRRAVVIGASRVRKLVRPGRAHRLAPPEALRPFRRSGLRTAEVIERGSSHISLELLPGRSLHDLGDEGMAGWERLARAWPAVVRATAALPRHTAAHETAVLRAWFDRTRATGALDVLDALAGRGRIERGVESACAALGEAGGPLVVSHRDLHDGQLLWDGRELSLLDLDTAATAEAALDLGNLAAHVDLMRIQGRLGPEAHNRVLGLLDDVAARLPTDSQRLRAYRAASLLRLALIHVFRPGAGPWLAAWTHHVLHTTTERRPS